MSDMRKIKQENYNPHRHTVIFSRMPQGSFGPVKTNRLLVYIVAALVLLLAIMAFLLFPSQKLLNDYQQQSLSKINTVEMNPAVSAEITRLKSQLVGLVSGSIESKLLVLEQSIQKGKISATGLGAIQGIKNDVNVLKSYSDVTVQKTYSETGAGRLIVEKYRNKESVTGVDLQLMQEVSQLKNLVYIIIASCGLMLAAIGGVWFQSRYRLSDLSVNKEPGDGKALGKH